MRPTASGIDRYAVIGDGRAAALVSRDGSIDWLCWPRFDSASLFAAILDDRGGRWSIRPVADFETERRYVEGTNVLETLFRTDSGVVRLTDVMAVASEEDKREQLVPEHEIVRLLECDAGEVEVEMVCAPRPRWAQTRPRIRNAGKLGIRMETSDGLLVLRTNLELQNGKDGSFHARTTMRAGDSEAFSLTFAREGPAVVPPLGAWTRETIARTTAWWRTWSARCRYDGPGRDAVLRSALALKLLAFAPTGAIVAAPTTSLPERPGGDLNWDYRFCWLRDASMTVRALYGLGFREEAEAFVGWLLHATRLTRPWLGAVYDVFGNAPPRERVLHHLAGFGGAAPVRVGNAARDQLQLDVYGEVIEAVTHFVDAGGTLDHETVKMLCGFGDYVCRHWEEPDEGIWEPRSGRAHRTHSKLMCWVALDRLLMLHGRACLPGAPADRYSWERSRLGRDIGLRAWNAGHGSYVGRLDGDELDASVLLLSWYGFEDASSPRMHRTYARLREHLGAGEALLYRYRSADSPGEGAFGACSFWGADYLAMGGGSAEEAMDAFDRLLSYANDVGLYGEEIEPVTGAPLGNFPQGLTHVGLINAALSLERRLKGLPPRGRRRRAAETEVRL